MRIVGGIVGGPLVIDEDTRLTGIVRGDVHVRAGCRLELKGIVSGDVLVEAGAILDPAGIVSGRMIRA